MSDTTEAAQVIQTIFADDPKRKGNCLAACIATVLGLPLDRVPHFIEFGITYGDSDDVTEVSGGNNWWSMLLGFLAGHGRWVVELEKVTDAETDEPVLVAGMSPRGMLHQVIYLEGRLWHDPHPSRAGVLDVREVLAIRPLPGFDHTPTTREAPVCTDPDCTIPKRLDRPMHGPHDFRAAAVAETYDGHTIDVGYVHVLTAPGGACVANCPHPEHTAPTLTESSTETRTT